jgi:hypothetical protein
MQNFLTKSSPGLLAIVTVTGLGYFVLMPPIAPPARAAAAEIASHSDKCSVCRLPLFGRSGEPSIFGSDSEDSTKAAHLGTIRK